MNPLVRRLVSVAGVVSLCIVLGACPSRRPKPPTPQPPADDPVVGDPPIVKSPAVEDDPSGTATSRGGGGSPSKEAPQTDPEGEDHALLVGCATYSNLAKYNLLGCVNDVVLMAARFENVLGIDRARIRMLTSPAPEGGQLPTREAILLELDGLAQRARENDRVLIYLAGHGSQQPDEAGGDEPDGFDEVFLPADVGGTKRVRGRKRIQNAITDDELYEKIEALLGKGVSVCLFSDSCHSATLARGGERRSRGIPVEEFDLELPGTGARGLRVPSAPGDAAAGANFVGLYAVQADEQAQEDALEEAAGRIHGIFSWSLATALTRTEGDVSFDQLLRLVVAGYRELGFEDISPFLQGDRRARLHRSSRRSAPVLLATGPADGVFTIDGGSLHGLHAGTRLALVDGDVRAELTVERVEPVGALARPSDAASIASLESKGPYTVEVTSQPTGAEPLKVFVGTGGAREWIAELSKLDPNGARVTLDAAREQADWTLEADGTSWRLGPGAVGSDRRYRVPAKDLAGTLLKLQRVTSLLRLPARAQPLPAGLVVELRRGDEPLASGERVTPGTRLELHAFNGTKHDHDLWVFWIDPDMGVYQVFPDPSLVDATPFLVSAAKSRKTTFKVQEQSVPITTLDDTQGTQQFLILAVPPGTSDLGFLESERLVPDERGDRAGAALVLDELAFGARGEPKPGKGLERDTHAALLAFDIEWEPLARPAGLQAVKLQRPAGDAPGEPRQGDRPDPWAFGDELFLIEREGLRVVLDDGAAPTRMLIDVGAPEIRPAELVRSVRAGTFAADLALVFAADGTRSAFYDTDLEGSRDGASPLFDLIRVETGGDARADLEHRFDGGAWRTRDDPAAPWLRLAELSFELIAPHDPFQAEDVVTAFLLESCHRSVKR